MHRKFLFLILLLLPLNLYGSDFHEDLLKKGDSFFKKKDFYKADFFYDAYLVDKDSCEAKFRSGLCKLYTKQYDKALSRFKETSSCRGKHQVSSYLALAEVYLEIGEPGLALVNLNNLESIGGENFVNRVRYEKAWLYLRFGKNQKAAQELNKILQTDSGNLQIESVEKSIPLLDKDIKSPVLSGIYSVVPGGGYLYCNRYKDAAYAFFINSILGAATWESFDNDMPVLGILLGSVTAGFYTGNIYGGIRAANFENRLYREKLYNDLENKYKKNNKKLLFQMAFDF